MKMWDKMGNEKRFTFHVIPFNAIEYLKCFSSLNLIVLFTKWNDDRTQMCQKYRLQHLHQRNGTREGYKQTIWWRDGDIVKIISFDPTNNELKSTIVQRPKVPSTEHPTPKHTLKYYFIYSNESLSFRPFESLRMSLKIFKGSILLLSYALQAT